MRKEGGQRKKGKTVAGKKALKKGGQTEARDEPMEEDIVRDFQFSSSESEED